MLLAGIADCIFDASLHQIEEFGFMSSEYVAGGWGLEDLGPFKYGQHFLKTFT